MVASPRAGRTTVTAIASHASALPAFAAVALMIVWAAHDGGYDADTWYWGALVVLGLLAAALCGFGARLVELSSALKTALVALSLYVAWSYLSITWARSPGDALQGSNRSLLYLLLFALFAVTPWTPRRALAVLLAFVLSVGLIGVVIFADLVVGGHAAALFGVGRLVSPTGYFNSSVALFTSTALVSIGLAARRELPALLRGVLLAIACAGVQLAVLGQSRGWLFTLPLVLATAILISRDRLRAAGAAILPIVAALVPLHDLLEVFRTSQTAHPEPHAFAHAAQTAGRAGLIAAGLTLLLGTLIAALDGRRTRNLGVRDRRALGIGATLLALAVATGGVFGATHGHPIRFARQQWHGFVHSSSETSSSGSHFAVVGTGRYDAWRVSLDAVLAHPVGGLGQDNFADYYVRHRRTPEELQWTHSLEFRLLAHTGIVGFGLFVAFMLAALTAARATVRRPPTTSAPAIAGIALLPFVVWLVHGSIDWFWETPALAGPALAFLALAGALRERGNRDTARPRWRPAARAVRVVAGAFGLLACTAVLGFPYLSIREVSLASDVGSQDPAAALRALSAAAKLNPLSAEPARIAGALALQTGRYAEAQRRFTEAISREPGGWFAWLGEGLASSALGEPDRAHQDFEVAAAINSVQPAVRQALARVYAPQPLTPLEAFHLFVLAH